MRRGGARRGGMRKGGGGDKRYLSPCNLSTYKRRHEDIVLGRENHRFPVARLPLFSTVWLTKSRAVSLS